MLRSFALRIVKQVIKCSVEDQLKVLLYRAVLLEGPFVLVIASRRLL